MKKAICLLCSLVLLLTLGACSKDGKGEKTTAKETTTAQKTKYIDAAVAENMKKTELFKTDSNTYYSALSEGKQVLCRTDLQGRMRVLLTFDEGEPTYYTETFERSGKQMLYYTYQNKGDETASLYAFNISTGREVKLIASPCSNFIVLHLPDTFEMYSYGFLAAADGMKVIDLKAGAVSTKYSMTVSQLKMFFVDPDSHPAVFFGRNLSTTIADMDDRTHIRVDTTEYKNNGEVKRKWSLSFSPALNVALEISDENTES